ncbi:hypothetical protein [Streptomyces colonosanans]|uniref:Uncharacterized protein n=1 Tax=Streptomyces colonosanans TaxID=1428652 RepID=A0A1S2P3Z4_9ACTN|nr:hypothetical protein [Streptomyces colonosanans]OIJ88408.1 hypothetical protein BIV24_22920 [Streptomyces colonosanans]
MIWWLWADRLRPLTRSTSVAALGALVLGIATLTGCGGSGHGDARPRAAAAQVALPAPRTAPAPAPTLTPAPRGGEVRIEQGPFTDRIRLAHLTLTKKPAVTGHLKITSDVSDVLALELRAAYYDAHGRLLGTGDFEYQKEGEDAHGAEHHDGPRAGRDGIDVVIPAKHLTDTPAAAVVSVPVLVNE